MKKYLTTLLSPVLFGLAAMLALPACATDGNATSQAKDSAAGQADGGATGKMQIMREKIYADKKFLVSSNMILTPAEEKAFWPIYDATSRT